MSNQILIDFIAEELIFIPNIYVKKNILLFRMFS